MFTQVHLSPGAEAASFFSDSTGVSRMKKPRKAVQAYTQVGENDVVSTTSATELMTMLFDKACVLLKTALQALEARDDQTF
jgi:hypothetical protein